MVKLFPQCIVRSIATLVVVGLIGAPLTSYGFFSNQESSLAQRFTATELILVPPATPEGMTVGPGVALQVSRTLPIVTTEASTESFFQLTSAAVSSDGLFCDALTLSAQRGSELISGHPNTFTSSSLNDYGDWELTIDYDVTQHDFVSGATCTVTLTVEAWQASMSQATAGYRDTTEVVLVVTADMSLVDLLSILGAGAPVSGVPLQQLSVLLMTDESDEEENVEDVLPPIVETINELASEELVEEFVVETESSELVEPPQEQAPKSVEEEPKEVEAPTEPVTESEE